MKSKRNKVALFAALLSLSVCTATQAANVWEVNKDGDITLNGEVFRVKGGSWFGLEGRFEAPNDEKNPGGAPMEMFMGNVWWSPSSRTLASDAAEFKQKGFNCIRMPVAPQTLHDDDPQGKGNALKNSPSVRIEGSFTALKAVIKACSDAGLYVLLDMHSCSNYVGWRKGRIDARPPWADANRQQYDYKRDSCSCSATGNPAGVTRIQAYDEAQWLEDLKTLAGMGDNIMGIDIFNEPWDYSWPEWRDLIDKAYTAIHAVNPNILIYAQGVGGSHGNQDGTPTTKEDTPYGKYNVNWGENLFSAGDDPPKVCPKSKLVYSPHCYGPSVCTQWMFADLTAQPECAGLVEDAFGDAKCQIKIDPTILEKGWDEHFGYLRALGYAIAVGEFGGNMDWPTTAEQRHQTRYAYLTDRKSDEEWQNAFVDYLVKRGMLNSFYWSINPESADTYGYYSTPYGPNNKSGWGTWGSPDAKKVALLNKLWTAPALATVHPVKRSTIGNGFNCLVSSSGQISYTMPKAGVVSLKVYNVSGRLQAELVNQHQDAGTYTINQKQIVPAAGSYMVSFKAGDYSQNQMVYLK